MKTFKNFQAFEKRVKKDLCWEDYFIVGGKQYKLYEYGGETSYGYSNVYFVNKKTHDAICVEYQCPSYSYLKGVKVKTKDYRFVSVEFIEDMDLWRTDTL